MATLSACLIVKNEEKLLPQCLDSIRDLADEIVLVDTGSEDDTVRIAKSYGCRIFHHKWRDDFSEARNFSIDQARGDWILWIDADEQLDESDIPVARKHMQNDNIDGIVVHMLSQKASGGYAWHALEKFFRTGKGHFEGIKHNQLYTTGKKVFAPIRIYHSGYNLDHEKMTMKWQRDEELLLKQIEEDEKDTFAWRNLVRLYSASKRHDEVIDVGLKVLAMGQDGVVLSPASEQLILADISDAYIQRGEYGEAEKTLMQLLEVNPASIDGNFRLAELYLRAELYQLAVEYYQRYIQFLHQAYVEPPKLALIIDSWGSAAAAQNNMAICYLETGNYAKALDTMKLAILQQREALDDQLVSFYKRVNTRSRVQQYIKESEV